MSLFNVVLFLSVGILVVGGILLFRTKWAFDILGVLPIVPSKPNKALTLLQKCNSDISCWVASQGFMYAPIFKPSNGFYASHNIFKKEDKIGELYFVNGEYRDKDNVFHRNDDANSVLPDMTIITGDMKSMGKYSSIKRLSSAEVADLTHKKFELSNGAKAEEFSYVTKVLLTFEESMTLKFSSRDDLHQQLCSLGEERTCKVAPDDKLLFVRTRTKLGVLFLVFARKVDCQNV